MKLLPEQRDYFRKIADLAFVNPFSRDREKSDCDLLNIPLNTLGFEQRSDAIHSMLKARLRELQALTAFRVNAFPEQDRQMMKFAWLFCQFHAYQDHFKQLILDQDQAGDESLTLSCAGDITAAFRRAGFDADETATGIALFYQLQRGFYFIGSSVTGDCPSIIELRMRLWNNIFTFNPRWYLDYLLGRMEEFSTLLLGATGSGKSLAARAIGCSGFIPYDLNKGRFVESFTRSFHAINLAQYPASLLESELFGHKKGAFTGAIENHPGIFARCSANGAVFIDEIGDIDMPTQVKLLNVIQDRTFSPVGSHEKLRFSGRLISATNRDIERMRGEGGFRDDLYYRLCSDVIRLPDLKQRLGENPDELKPLVDSIVRRLVPDPGEQLVMRIVRQIRATVPAGYHWPGNVRELEQCIRRICLTGSYQAGKMTLNADEAQNLNLPVNEEISVQQLIRRYCRQLYDKHGSYEAVARITRLDRRTAKKYIAGSEDHS